MKTLSPSVNSLLDKLYNLRGEDSVLLVEMDEQKLKSEETKTRTTIQKVELQAKISEFEKLHDELEYQGERLKNVLVGIDRSEYATVLDRLQIDFNPNNLADKLERTLPRAIENVIKDTKKAEEELIKVEEEMDDAMTTIEEVGIRRDTALSNQQKLNEYFDLALTGRINITRDSITSLLEQFKFSDEEQREAAKILMFPEDALFTYEERLKERNRSGKSISEVISEAKSVVDEEPVIEETIEEPIIEYDNTEIESVPVVDNVVTFDEIKIEDTPTIEVKSNPKDEVIDTLVSNGVDYLDYSSNEINNLINNFDKETVNKNISYIKSLGLGTDVFVNHIALMYDKDLKDKFEVVLSIGKTLNDIYLSPNILVKYDLQNLMMAINMVKSSGLDPKTVPLVAY